jgi:hypothetical protein
VRAAHAGRTYSILRIGEATIRIAPKAKMAGGYFPDNALEISFKDNLPLRDNLTGSVDGDATVPSASVFLRTKTACV